MAGVICAVYKCKNYGVSNCSKSYFRFPTDREICQQWVHVCNRKDLDSVFKKFGPEHLYKNYRVCSDHFPITSFRNPNLSSQGLIKGQIPSQNLYRKKDTPSDVSPKKRLLQGQIPSQNLYQQQDTPSHVSPKKRDFKIMEETHFIKCEPGRTSGTQGLSEFDNDAQLPCVNPMKIKVEPFEQSDEAGEGEEIADSIKEELEIEDMKEEPTRDDDICCTVPNEMQYAIWEASDEYGTDSREHDNESVAISCDSDSSRQSRIVVIYREKKSLACTHCSKVFAKQSTLASHILIHTGEKPFVCNICGKSFNKKGGLKVHVMRHNGEKPHLCSECGVAFTEGWELRRHMVKHNGETQFVCKLCGKGFCQSSSLRVHMRYHNGQKDMLCSNCGKAFVTKGELRRHMPTHTNEKLYKCVQCNKSYFHEATLKEHLLKHAGIRLMSCKFCEKTFASKTGLLFHSRVHTERLLHKCSLCTKSYTTRTSLDLHMPFHTGEKPHVCPTCGKAFSVRSNMKRHWLKVCK